MTFFSFFFRKKIFFLKKNFCTKIGKIPITIHYISHIFKPFLLMGGVGVFLSGWVGYGWTRGMGGWVGLFMGAEMVK
jgi:hypothetical protein